MRDGIASGRTLRQFEHDLNITASKAADALGVPLYTWHKWAHYDTGIPLAVLGEWLDRGDMAREFALRVIQGWLSRYDVSIHIDR